MTTTPSTTTEESIIARNIETARKRLGMTQSALANHMRDHGVNWSQVTVSHLENGKRQLLATEATRLARILGTTFDALTSDHTTPRHDPIDALVTAVTCATRSPLAPVTIPPERLHAWKETHRRRPTPPRVVAPHPETPGVSAVQISNQRAA